MFQCSYTYRYL